jgi:uncharacterized protein (TIGR03435 family)
MGPMRIVIVLAGLLTIPASSRPFAGRQAAPPPAERVSFEVATVRQNKTGTGLGQQRRLPGGRYTATNMPLRGLIRVAYGSAWLFRGEDQMVGGPGWIDSDRFDIDAKAATEFVADPDGVTRQHLAMLRSLLEDRFRLKARVEKRELPTYALVMAKKDGALGPDLKRSTLDCGPGAPPPPAGIKCGISSDGPTLVGTALPMAALVTFLNISPAVGRLVQDHTGLTGLFDMRLNFARPFVIGPGGAVPNPDVDSGPTIFTALQEQLGLKLESRKAAVDVLVIESIERLVVEKQ